MNTTRTNAPIPLASLPSVGAPFNDGTFVGLSTTADGRHVAIVRLAVTSERGQLTAGQARTWAALAGGTLPTRAVAALVYFTLPEMARALRYWTCEVGRVGYSWAAGRGEKHSGHDFATYEIPANAECAVYAVREIPIAAADLDTLPMRVAALEARSAVALADRVAALEARLQAA